MLLDEQNYNYYMNQVKHAKTDNDKGRISESVAGYLFMKYLLKEYQQMLFNNTAEHQMYGDFIIYDYKSLSSTLEDRKHMRITNTPVALVDDYYFLECKTSSVNSKNQEAQFFIPMRELLANDNNRIPYRQGNTGTSIAWGYNNTQPRILTTYCIKKQRLYVFNNWQSLCLEAKEQYHRALAGEKLYLPWNHQPKSPEYDNKTGKHKEIIIDDVPYKKYSDCMILRLEQMTHDFIIQYDIDVYDVDVKLIS